jgi:hypothetical protein
MTLDARPERVKRPKHDIFVSNKASQLGGLSHAFRHAGMDSRRSEMLTHGERHQLREALEREAAQAVALPSAGAGNDRREHAQRWLGEHRDEYLGQWVALEGDRLLASGPDGRAVYEAARSAGVRAPLVTRVELRDELPFAGW